MQNWVLGPKTCGSLRKGTGLSPLIIQEVYIGVCSNVLSYRHIHCFENTSLYPIQVKQFWIWQRKTKGHDLRSFLLRNRKIMLKNINSLMLVTVLFHYLWHASSESAELHSQPAASSLQHVQELLGWLCFSAKHHRVNQIQDMKTWCIFNEALCATYAAQQIWQERECHPVRQHHL